MKTNREIKFRGKRVDDNEWVYGVVGYHKYDEKWYVCDEKLENYEAIPKTIGQYTNLKDKNGVEIYEGDIVKCKLIEQVKKNNKWVNEEIYENYEVIYSNEDLGFRFKDEWKTIWKFENCELEVIGNIYDELKDSDD